MKQLQDIALGFLAASVIVHVFVVVDLFLVPLADWPRFLWILYAGIPICFFPALYHMSNRLSAERQERGGNVGLSDYRSFRYPVPDQRQAFVFFAYAFVLYYVDILNDPTGDVDMWLFHSTGWVGIYYLTWYLIRRERSFTSS